MPNLRFTLLVALLLTAAHLTGCASSTESAGRQNLSAHVGRYDAPPPGLARPRTGVPAFEMTGSGSSRQLAEVAADQLTTLAVNCERFEVIERAQLSQLLKEQGLDGVVNPNELAQSGRVSGVEYLLIGKVSNLRVKAEESKRGFGIGNVRLPGAGGIGAFDFKKKSSTMTAECGVDLRLVHATTGSVACAQHTDYTRTDSVGAFGIEILGVDADADASLKLDEDNKGLILRLALDDALRQMLPKLDRYLVSKAGSNPPSAPGGAGFCSQCGAKLAESAKFCGGCGTKTE